MRTIEKMANDLNKENHKLKEVNKQLFEALEEIAKGEGRYSMDALQHASNTIVDMKYIAEKILLKLS